MKISINIPGHCAGSDARKNNFLSCSCVFQNLFIFVMQPRGDATGCGNSRYGIFRTELRPHIAWPFFFVPTSAPIFSFYFIDNYLFTYNYNFMINEYVIKYRLANRVYQRGHFDYVGLRATTEQSAKEKAVAAFRSACLVYDCLIVEPRLARQHPLSKTGVKLTDATENFCP